jgi:hypothetical protein
MHVGNRRAPGTVSLQGVAGSFRMEAREGYGFTNNGILPFCYFYQSRKNVITSFPLF